MSDSLLSIVSVPDVLLMKIATLCSGNATRTGQSHNAKRKQLHMLSGRAGRIVSAW